MHYDRFKNCLWLHSQKNLYQLQIENEDRDIWKSYLEKDDYQLALSHCEHKNPEIAKKVSKLFASHLFDNKDYNNAAIYYARSDARFEDVALKFLVNNQYDTLKSKNFNFNFLIFFF